MEQGRLRHDRKLRSCRVENTYYADIALTLPATAYRSPGYCITTGWHASFSCRIWATSILVLRNESWNVRRKMYENSPSCEEAPCVFDEAFLSGRTALWMPTRTLSLGEGLLQRELSPGSAGFRSNLLLQSWKKNCRDWLKRLASQNPTLVHRDLQSQNVMIHDGEPFLIDFQGMRFGNWLYDLGSLLCDPYVRFSAEERHQLLSFYYGLTSSEPDWNEFLKAFWEASAQRLMQALGAYGFLGIRKGLKSYLAHVPSGLRNLCVAAENAGSLPLLLEISMQCERTISAGVSSSTRVF